MGPDEFRALYNLPPRDAAKVVATLSKTRFNHGNKNHHHGVSHPKPQRQPSPALGGQTEGQGGSKTRTVVSIVSHRVRLLDADNHAGGCKHLLDCIKEAGLIEDDSPRHIRLITDQVQVAHYHEERIEIEITP